MQRTKPYLFIGSSSEAIESGLVDQFKQSISQSAYPVTWNIVPEFNQSGSASTFDSLQIAANEYDFAAFILTPDDELKSRGKKYSAPRDNLWFELGLFVGTIGPERVFFSAAKQEGTNELKIASDLAGIQCPRFHYSKTANKETLSSIDTLAGAWRSQIQQRGFRRIELQIVSQWYYDTNAKAFRVTVGASKIVRQQAKIGKWQISVATRLRDDTINFEQDDRVVYSAARLLPPIVDADMDFHIPSEELCRGGKKLTAGDEIQARIVLIPEGEHLDTNLTLEELIWCRCRDVERLSFELGQIHASSPSVTTKKAKKKASKIAKKKTPKKRTSFYGKKKTAKRAM